jgi:uncharacterized OB-fold protein
MPEQPAPPTVPPLPAPDALSQPFWDGAREHKLVILRCQACGLYLHPPRPVCRACLSMDVAPEEVSGRATLYTWTVVEQAFGAYYATQVPYVYATVELVEQADLRLVTNIVDVPFDQLRAGMDLEVTFHDLSAELTLPRFRPARA